MNRLFLDTNVLLCFHFKDAELRQQKAIDLIFLSIEQKRWQGFISLITFYQLLYFIDRKLNSPRTATQRAYAYLNIIQVAPFDPTFLSSLDPERWPDYEDGLQYVCAQSGNCEVVITTNSPDFFSSTLPVIDPLNFVLQYDQ